MSNPDRTRMAHILREVEGYLELGLPVQALRALDRLTEPQASRTHALYLRGEALRAQEKHAAAIDPLRKASRLDPENIHIWLALGWCHKRTGNLQQAIVALENALRADPEEPLLHYNLACYWSLAGDKNRCLRFLSQALAMDGGYRDLIGTERDFDPFRADPDFLAITSIVV